MIARAPFISMVVGLALLVAPSVRAEPEPLARAESSDVRRKAREAFEEGIALLDARDLARAAKAFERVLALRQHLPALYNLAVCYQGLGRFKEAKSALESFLALAAASPPPEQALARAHSLLTAVTANIAHLDLEVRGRAELVFLDDQKVAQGDGELSLELDPGEHRVRAERRGYESLEFTVRVFGGARERLVVDASTRPLLGRLSIVPEPSDAEVWLDGQPLGRGVVSRSLPPGPHQVEVVAPDHVSLRREVIVASDRTETLKLTLEREAPAITETWWFWVGLGVAAIGAGTAIAFAASGGPDGGSLDHNVVVGGRGR